MGRFAVDRFQSDRRFKYACCAVPMLFAVWWFFGDGGGSSGSQPAPPPIFAGSGGTGTGGPPPYQFGTVQTAPAPPDPASVQRQNRFVAAAAAAAAETRPGHRCELMLQAAKYLTAPDRAQLVPAAATAQADADSCQASIDLSDGRLAALEKAAAAYAADTTPATATALSRADQQLQPFDLSRDEFVRRQALRDAAQAATLSLQASDTRLQAFAAAAAQWHGGATPDTEGKLAGAAQVLSSFDDGRLSAAQLADKRSGLDLAETLAASDRRLAAAVQAAALPGQGRDTLAGLVAAIGVLQPEDWQRTSTEQQKILANAQALAKAAALTLLTQAATTPKAGADPTADEAAAQARRVVGTIDPALLSPEQRQAIDQADQANARITASNARIAAARSAVDAWRRAHSTQTGRQIINSQQAVNPYDRERLSGPQAELLDQLEAAYFAAAGKTIGLSPATRGQIPVFVTIRPGTSGDDKSLLSVALVISPDRAAEISPLRCGWRVTLALWGAARQ